MDPRDLDPQHEAHDADIPRDAEDPTIVIPQSPLAGATEPLAGVGAPPPFSPPPYTPGAMPPVRGATAPASSRPSGPSRRRWLLIGGAVLVLVLLIGGGVAFTVYNANAAAAATAAIQPTGTPKPTAKAAIYTVTQVTMTSPGDASAPATASAATPGASAAPTVLATISATDPSGNPMTITVTSATVIMQGKTSATLAAIVPGTRIRVAGKHHKGDILAKRIGIVKARSGSGTLPGSTPVSTPNS